MRSLPTWAIAVCLVCQLAYLFLIEDDYSRYIVGWALCEGERAEAVIEAVDAAIARHGKPEQMVVDGGSGFFSWRGQSQLERVCGDYGIDFIKASKKGSNSKLEALNANVRKELLSRVEFADLADARAQIARWVSTLTNPSVLVEVLSESTEQYDREEKRAHYLQIPSLQAYLLVSQQARQVDVWLRSSGDWTFASVGAGEKIALLNLQGYLEIDELYEGIL